MKRIANIVFYKFNGERPNMKQACIFYTDGTVKNVSYEDGLEACQEIVTQYQVTSRQQFKEMINNSAIYVMSGKEFESRFQSFISREDEQTALIPVQPQKTDLVPYQKVLKPNTNKGKDDYKEEDLSKVVVPSSFVDEINDDIEKHEKFVNNTNNIVTPEEDFINDEIDNNEELNNFEATPVVEPVTPVTRKPKTANNNNNNVNPVVGNNTNNNGVVNQPNNTSKRGPVVAPVFVNNNNDNDQLDQDFINGLDEESINRPTNNNQNRPNANINTPIEDEGLEDEYDNDNVETPIVTPIVTPKNNTNNTNNTNDDFEDLDDYEDVEDYELDEEDVIDSDDIDTDIEDDLTEEKTDEPKEEKGFFAWIKRGIEKIKKSKLVKRITAVVLALAVGLGLYSCASRQTKSGEMLNSNLTTSSQDVNDLMGKRGGHLFLIHGNNDHYNDYSFEELQKVTKAEAQKDAMYQANESLIGFNDTFANAHTEEGVDVKAALTVDEVIALQQAYNNYSNEEIRAIFNGATIRSDEMTRAYKDANLQLMGAYVIETRENPVDMSGLINSEEGKAFYQKYQDLFLNAKEATGEEKLKAIELFFAEVRKDFPITNDVRTEGIAHADDYATIEPYKLAVTPIISAAEIMFQNYRVDHTLQDGEIDFLNDLGLCNYADETFDRIETLTLTNPEDNKNPLYEQYRQAMIYDMKINGNYYVDDEHRELTKLHAFQEQVNWHAFEGRWVYSGYTYYTTETHTETKTWTETTTTTRVEETEVEKPITEEAKQEVDEQIERENEQARQEAEEEAEKNRQEMQEEADEEAERIEEEVKQDEEDFQENIEDANEQIENNQDDDPTNDAPVNEDDLGHGTDFDDEYSDENGNLDDSVENITTDPHGDETGQDFPDPNETGKAFDEAGEAMYGQNSNTSTDGSFSTEFNGEPFSVEENIPQTSTDGEPKAAATEQSIYEYEVPLTNEQIVDMYIEQLANNPSTDEKGYQYTK